MMAGKLFLHIGAPKTATSSIQTFLNTHTSFLHQQGLHYLRSGLSMNHQCHHELVWAMELHPALSYVDQDITKRKSEILASLGEEIERHSEYDLILSSELLFFLHDFGRIVPLLSLFKDREVNVVVYVRKQDKFLESLYQQIVKDGGKIGFEEWVSHAKQIGNYNLMLNRLFKVFSREQIIVDVFDSRREDFHPIKNFLGLIGIPKDSFLEYPIENIKINEALTREQVGKLVEINKKNPSKRFEMIKQFSEENKNFDRNNTEFFKKDEREDILKTYLETNLNFFKRCKLSSEKAKYLFY